MAVCVKFTRNKPPYNAGEKIGVDRVTADKPVRAGYAVEHDLEAEARAASPRSKASSTEPPKADGAAGSKGGDAGKSPDSDKSSDGK